MSQGGGADGAGGNAAFSARTLSLRLTGFPSVTGTAGERDFAPFLRELLLALPYFRAHPGDLMLLPIPGDLLERSSVLALVRGSGPATVLLSGHYDVVSAADYGALEPLAFDPEALLPALLKEAAAEPATAGVAADLASGDFLPGRGLLDMKAGLAAGLAALARFAGLEERQGNLLFVATPDEEDRSSGMRAVAAALPRFGAERGLQLRAGINLDATSDQGGGESGQVVALGTIGKLLLSAYVVGQPSHACYPFDGVNAGFLAAELVRAFEGAAALTEGAPGLGVSPTLLGVRDLKPAYDVTTPGEVWCFWNVIVQRRDAREVMDAALGLAGAALEEALGRLHARAASFGRSLPETVAQGVGLWRFEGVKAAAMARGGDLEAEAARFAAGLPTGLDLPAQSLELTRWWWRASGLRGPAVVFGFASLPYSSATLADDDAGRTLARLAEEAAAEVAAAHATPIGVRPYFAAISDISFLAPVAADGLGFTARNMPVWDHAVGWDLAAPGPELPMLNAGPWGRDYHQLFERVYAPYAFKVLPELVWTLARKILRAP